MTRRQPWLTLLAGCIAVALAHVLLHSMVNSGRPWTPSAWPRLITGAVETHATWAPFAKRPLMNGILRLLGDITGWSAWSRFLIAQFALLVWAATETMLTASRIAEWRGDDPATRTADVRRVLLLFFIYPPILFALFSPVYTFDDLIVAAAVVRSVRHVIDGRWIAAAFWLAVAAVGHEIAVFVTPALAWLAWDLGGTRGSRIARVATLTIAPVVAWLGVKALMGGHDMTGRFTSYLTNFGTSADLIASFGSIMLALGLPAVLILSRRPAKPPHLARYYAAAQAIVLAVVSVAAFFREFRLIALPGYFVMPFLGPVIRLDSLRLSDRWQVGIAAIVATATTLLYRPVIASAPWAFRIYVGVIVGSFASVAAFHARRLSPRAPPSPPA